jgi:glycosyltransferase involved in cell wall biosynthesis
MSFNEELNVLMVTGVYLPESNGAVLQCNQLINNLGKSIQFSVLTGTNNKVLEGNDCVDGVCITRVFIPKDPSFWFAISYLRFFIKLFRAIMKIDLIHIHGFSKRNAVVILVSRILNKKVILKMTSFGQDDPSSVKNCFPDIFWQIFKCCHAYIGISPAFATSYQEANLPENKYYSIPNGVDLDRFSPLSNEERIELRLKYGFSKDDKIILFVGHFSPEKRPMLLYRAWVKLCEQNICTKLIFIGHTKNHFEVDGEMVDKIKKDAGARKFSPLISFVESTLHVDEYMKIADVFVMPSIREGLPNALLEAMSCAIPCVVTNLSGVTDWLIEDGKTGVLFRSDEPSDLYEKIIPYVTKLTVSKQMGEAARYSIEENFSSVSTSSQVFNLYRRIIH